MTQQTFSRARQAGKEHQPLLGRELTQLLMHGRVVLHDHTLSLTTATPLSRLRMTGNYRVCQGCMVLRRLVKANSL
jgi:hypothetical protein